LQVKLGLFSVMVVIRKMHDLNRWSLPDNCLEVVALGQLEIAFVVREPALYDSRRVLSEQ